MNKDLYYIYRNINKLNDPMYKYISYFLDGKKSYKEFLTIYSEALDLYRDNFPFEKVNKRFFKIIENFCGRDNDLINNFFRNLYIEQNYDVFASFLSNMQYSYIFLKEEKDLEETNPEFNMLFKTMIDILEMIASYVRGDDKFYIPEIANSLLAIEWIDKTYNFDEVYVKIKDIIGCHISIVDFCSLAGIKLDVVTTRKSVFIANEMCNYEKERKVIH